MKTTNNLYLTIFILTFSFSAINLYGYDYSPSCLKKIESNFFEQRYVEQALNLHKVGQSSWALIIRDLKDRSKKVPMLMMSKARTMRPNPLDSPFDGSEAEKILIPILLSVFRETLISFNFNDESGIRDMFNYIYSFQKSRLKQCLYKTKA